MKKGEAVSAPEFKLVEKSGESLECRAGEYASALHQLSTDYKTCGWMLTRDAALWGLKQGEEERARLQRACAERCEQQQKLADDVRKVARERDATQAKCEALEARIQELRAALELIAAPKRADGTYNRSREACAQLAREALAKDG